MTYGGGILAEPPAVEYLFLIPGEPPEMAKIGFDSTGFTYDDAAWREVIRLLERHLLSEGLPPVSGDRWEEWEAG